MRGIEITDLSVGWSRGLVGPAVTTGQTQSFIEVLCVSILILFSQNICDETSFCFLTAELVRESGDGDGKKCRSHQEFSAVFKIQMEIRFHAIFLMMFDKRWGCVTPINSPADWGGAEESCGGVSLDGGV